MCKIIEDGKETKIKQTWLYKQTSQLHVNVGKVKTGGLGVRVRAPPSPPPLAPISFHARTCYA